MKFLFPHICDICMQCKGTEAMDTDQGYLIVCKDCFDKYCEPYEDTI